MDIISLVRMHCRMCGTKWDRQLFVIILELHLCAKYHLIAKLDVVVVLHLCMTQLVCNTFGQFERVYIVGKTNTETIANLVMALALAHVAQMSAIILLFVCAL